MTICISVNDRDETIDVGADLYELDTEGEASLSASEAEEAVHVGTTAEIIAASSNPLSDSQEAGPNILHRTPSIHFLGKDGWAKLKSQQHMSEKEMAPKLSIPKTGAGKISPYATNVVYDDVRVSHPMYGRPQFTEVEIEALLMGIEGDPDVIRHSSGAKFKM